MKMKNTERMWAGIVAGTVVMILMLAGGADALVWSSETVDSTGDVGEFNSIALDSHDKPHISYYDLTNKDLKYAKLGSTWNKETVDSPGNVGAYSSLALDAGGNPHISYMNLTNELVHPPGSPFPLTVDLKYATLIDQGGLRYWDRQIAGSTGFEGGFTSIALGSSGNPHISYPYYGLEFNHLYHTEKIGNEWKWKSVASSSTQFSFGIASSSLALDTADIPHISYYLDNTLYYAWNNSGWSRKNVDSDAGYLNSIALDSSGTPHISYSSGAGLKYARLNGGSWDIQLVDPAPGVGFNSIAIDSTGAPHISYSTGNGLKYARWDGGWHIQIVDPTTVSYNSIAVDSADNPHISYYDDNNKDLKYANGLPDDTPPMTTASISGTAGNNDWYISDVIVTLSAIDNPGGESIMRTEYSFDGINWITYTAPFTISNEGTVTFYYRSIDNAANTEVAKTGTVKIDKTAPEISGSPTNLPNSNGWYNKSVVVHFTASDALSGIDTVTPDTVLSANASSQSVTGIATDLAGNSKSIVVSGINIDMIPPVITGSPTTAPNSNGWYNSSVIIHLTATDAISGIDSVTPDTVLSANASSQSVTGTATDLAGNSNSYIVSGINIDMIPPEISGSPTNLPNSNGWYNKSVVVHFTASDALSGIDTVTQDTVLSANASSQSVTGIATDLAGNSKSIVVSGINIDMIPPVTNIILAGTPGNNNWYILRNVTVILIPADSISGVAGSETSFDGIAWNIYTAPFNITMQGETKVYYRSIDNAGNAEDPKNQTVKIDSIRPNLNTNPIVRNATNSSGAVVDYIAQRNVTASDSNSGLLSLACLPPPGLFPLGTTGVNCIAEDIAGNNRSGSFDITIRDGTPPETSIFTVVDGNGIVILSDTLNTTVNFTFSGMDYIGTDIVNNPLSFRCRHSEYTGSAWIRSSWVLCTSPWKYTNLTTARTHSIEVYAIDNSSNRDLSPANFTWFITSPVLAVQNLIATIDNMALPAGEKTSLDAPVRESVPLLTDSNPTNDVAVCGKMTSLIEKVNAREKTHRMTALQARQIRLPAKDIQNGVGCYNQAENRW